MLAVYMTIEPIAAGSGGAANPRLRAPNIKRLH